MKDTRSFQITAQTCAILAALFMFSGAITFTPVASVGGSLLALIGIFLWTAARLSKNEDESLYATTTAKEEIKYLEGYGELAWNEWETPAQKLEFMRHLYHKTYIVHKDADVPNFQAIKDRADALDCDDVGISKKHPRSAELNDQMRAYRNEHEPNRNGAPEGMNEILAQIFGAGR